MPSVMLETPPAPMAGSLRTNGQCVVALVVLTGGESFPSLYRWACHGGQRGPWLQIPEFSVSQRQGLGLRQAKKGLISKENSQASSRLEACAQLCHCQLLEEVLGCVVCATTHPWPACLSTQSWRLQFPETCRGQALGEEVGCEAQWWREREEVGRENPIHPLPF